jgi:hypothetical protein
MSPRTSGFGKIEKNPSNPKYLATESWVGYRLRLPE